MKKIILSGCNGQMGQTIVRCVAACPDCEIVAGIDVNTARLNGFPVFSAPRDVTVAADVIIDFSHPAVILPLLEFAKSSKLPIVACTTGCTAEQIKQVKASAFHIPVFFSGNMSLGINLMIELSKLAASLLSSQFDIEIIEKHHNQKLDSPSGTALMLADGISSVLETSPRYEYERHAKRTKRTKNEIGIHSIRGGTIVGEHEVIFAGNNELLSISHRAQSKEVFGVGAVNAAVFLADQPPGLYDMSALVQSVLNTKIGEREKNG